MCDAKCEGDMPILLKLDEFVLEQKEMELFDKCEAEHNEKLSGHIYGDDSIGCDLFDDSIIFEWKKMMGRILYQ